MWRSAIWIVGRAVVGRWDCDVRGVRARGVESRRGFLRGRGRLYGLEGGRGEGS